MAAEVAIPPSLFGGLAPAGRGGEKPALLGDQHRDQLADEGPPGLCAGLAAHAPPARQQSCSQDQARCAGTWCAAAARWHRAQVTAASGEVFPPEPAWWACSRPQPPGRARPAAGGRRHVIYCMTSSAPAGPRVAASEATGLGQAGRRSGALRPRERRGKRGGPARPTRDTDGFATNPVAAGRIPGARRGRVEKVPPGPRGQMDRLRNPPYRGCGQRG